MEPWIPFEYFRSYGWKDELVVSCHLGKVYQFTEGRNAWWGSPSNRYPGMKSFWPDIEHAKAEVERRRKQGSQWHIRELPVVVISGKANAVVIGEINADEPLWTLLKPGADFLTLEQSGSFFAPRRPDSVIRIFCARQLIPKATQPFHLYRSISHGGKHVPLWWGMRHYDDGSLDRTRQLARRITRRIRATSSGPRDLRTSTRRR